MMQAASLFTEAHPAIAAFIYLGIGISLLFISKAGSNYLTRRARIRRRLRQDW